MASFAHPQNISAELYDQLHQLLFTETRYISLEDPFSGGGRLRMQIKRLQATHRLEADQLEAMLYTIAGQPAAAESALRNAHGLGMPADMYAQNRMQLYAYTGQFSHARAATADFLATPPDLWATDMAGSGICALHNADLLPEAIEAASALCTPAQRAAWQPMADETLAISQLMHDLGIAHADLLQVLDAIGSVLHAAGILPVGAHTRIEARVAQPHLGTDAAMALHFICSNISPSEAAQLDDALSDLIASTSHTHPCAVLPFIIAGLPANQPTPLSAPQPA